MNILGINIGHDSGAALIMDGKIVAAINEERLSRLKMHHGFPYLAIKEVLSIGNIFISQLDSIAVEGLKIMPQQEVGFEGKSTDWKKKLISAFGLEKFILGTESGLALTRAFLHFSVKKSKKEIAAYFKKQNFKGELIHVDHHLCHAATAFYTQSKNKGLAITLDASGEGYCSRVYECNDNKLTLLQSLYCYHSPAYYYAYITKLLGFKPLRHEGKITGLAAFGKPEKVSETLSEFIYFDKKLMSFVNKGGYHFEAMSKLKKALADFSKEDIAAGIQHWCEIITCEYVNALIEKYNGNKKTDVFLAGGLFANVKINQRIAEQNNVNSVFVFPNMGDGGVALGAALMVGFEKKSLQHKIELSNLYLGRNFNDVDIQNEFHHLKVPYKKSENIAHDVAIALAEGKVVARFNGAMEYGPRALGNRSIIYSAKDKSVNEWLNKRLNRTEFMPFAPFVRDVDYKDFFKIDESQTHPFRFMTITCDVTEKCKQEAPAITHVDGTARPQIVYRESNPSYYDILTEYKKITGHSVLVNTSFNMHEEPIINTPEEAIKTFQLGGLDMLAIGNFIVTL